jgi:hypothetical protein
MSLCAAYMRGRRTCDVRSFVQIGKPQRTHTTSGPHAKTPRMYVGNQCGKFHQFVHVSTSLNVERHLS